MSTASFKSLISVSVLAMTLVACAPKTETITFNIQPKTPAEKKIADARAHELVPLLYPKLAEASSPLDTPAKREEMMASFRQSLPNSEFNQCLLRAGLDKYFINYLFDSVKPQQVSNRLAEIWATRYSNDQLAKVLGFVKSSVFQNSFKRSQLTHEPALVVLKKMHEEGKVSDNDLRFFLSTTADSDVSIFFKVSETDLENAIDAKVTEVRQNPMAFTKKFMEEKAVAFIECNPNGGSK